MGHRGLDPQREAGGLGVKVHVTGEREVMGIV